MKRNKIVTHSGKAHRDEYLACCAIMYTSYCDGLQTFVERRMAGESDLASKDVWVVDTGGHHDPGMRNFDHHQSDAVVKGSCAFDLVMRHLLGSSYDSYRESQPWIQTVGLHDTMGASDTAKELGMDIKSYVATRSPIEKYTLSTFGELAIVHVDSPLSHCMRETGRMLILEATASTTGADEKLANTPGPFDHAGIRIWDIRSVWDGEDSYVPVNAINRAASFRKVDLVVGRNQGNGGISLHRQGWATDKMDFSKLSGLPGVLFAHQRGFYAVVSSDIADSDLVALIRASSLAE